MSDYLPQEILLQIFHKLPNKAVGRCMCVCKYWLSLIKDPTFVSTRLEHAISSKTDPLLLLKLCSDQELQVQYSLRFDGEEFTEYKQLRVPFKQDHPSFCIIGSCHGLVCFMHNLYTSNYTFVLWNPLIRKCLMLPKPNVTFDTHGAFEALAGFGFDSRTNDYKVVRVLQLLENDNEDDEDEEVAIEMEIFSLNKNSWRSITNVAPQYGIVERGSQAFVNGAVHWVATRRHKNGTSLNLILALDMRTECFHELMLPESLSNENPMFLRVSAYKDSTIAVFKRKYVGFAEDEIWLMKEYGKAEAWTKLLTVGRYGGGVPRALGFRSNGEVIFELYSGDLVSVDLESLEVYDLTICGAPGYALVDQFVETLVLLDQPIKRYQKMEAKDSGESSF